MNFLSPRKGIITEILTKFKSSSLEEKEIQEAFLEEFSVDALQQIPIRDLEAFILGRFKWVQKKLPKGGLSSIEIKKIKILIPTNLK